MDVVQAVCEHLERGEGGVVPGGVEAPEGVCERVPPQPVGGRLAQVRVGVEHQAGQGRAKQGQEATWNEIQYYDMNRIPWYIFR